MQHVNRKWEIRNSQNVRFTVLSTACWPIFFPLLPRMWVLPFVLFADLSICVLLARLWVLYLICPVCCLLTCLAFFFLISLWVLPVVCPILFTCWPLLCLYPPDCKCCHLFIPFTSLLTLLLLCLCLPACKCCPLCIFIFVACWPLSGTCQRSSVTLHSCLQPACSVHGHKRVSLFVPFIVCWSHFCSPGCEFSCSYCLLSAHLSYSVLLTRMWVPPLIHLLLSADFFPTIVAF